jgi:hypothetical protein
MMNKTEFIGKQQRRSLINYLAKCWDDFDNNLSFTNHSQQKFRKEQGKSSTYKSLNSAFYDYKLGENHENQEIDFISSTRDLVEMRKAIINAYENVEDEKSCELFVQLCRVLKWGGVLTNSITGPLLDKHLNGELSEYMTWVIDEKPFDATSEELNVFDTPPNKLLSDSGTTKIYSVVGDECIIYDDRVAAALCYLISKYVPADKPLPEELRLVRGIRVSSDQGNRDPSTPNHRFRAKGKDKEIHAQSNLKANWLISEVVKKLMRDNSDFKATVEESCKEVGFRDEQWMAMRIYESALFMAGHTVPYTKLK